MRHLAASCQIQVCCLQFFANFPHKPHEDSSGQYLSGRSHHMANSRSRDQKITSSVIVLCPDAACVRAPVRSHELQACILHGERGPQDAPTVAPQPSLVRAIATVPNLLPSKSDTRKCIKGMQLHSHDV